MRILLLNCSYDSQFTEPATLLNRYETLTGWSEALIAAGASAVTVLQAFASNARIQRGGVEYVFRKISRASWRSALRRVLAEHPVDIVHVNGLIFPWPTWCLRTVPGSPAIIVQDHGGAEPSLNPLRWFGQRLGLGVADAFLFSHDELARPWQTVELVEPHQRVYAVMESSTTMHGVPHDRAHEMSGIEGSPAVLWVGRLNANKDPMTVLDGFERAVRVLPNAQLTMVYSSDELLPQVRARIEHSPELRKRVHMRGYITHDRLPAFYSAADLFVLGSHREGSGFALLEALACGVTPVVTDIPAFRAITGDGAVGMLWPIGNAVALARSLALAAGSDLIAARAAVLEHFQRELSWPVVARRAMSAYADVLARKVHS